jgi:exodeoxyribonuclease V alpha subunit
MNRGGGGARSVNIELQAALNPVGDRKVERFGWTFAPGDKILHIENDYDKEVYNGDIGYIDNVDPDAGEIIASFDGRAVTYGFGKLDMLVPAYAATIHKSQGSEYPAVVIPMLTQHYAMLQRNLLYTGVTRGKRLVVLVGQKKAIAIAVRNVSGRRRWSKLMEWLSADAEASTDTIPEDLAALRRAVRSLEHPDLAAPLGNMLGNPIKPILDVLPIPARHAFCHRHLQRS